MAGRSKVRSDEAVASASRRRFSVPTAAQLACVLEATAPKLGNVHPTAAFDDLTYVDFVFAAGALADTLRTTVGEPMGWRIVQAVRRSREVTRSNANLGMVLLIVPLAATAEQDKLESRNVAAVFDSLSADDARNTYAAIQLAGAGGMGKVERYDVNAAPPADLQAAMRDAAERDRIARQWVTGMSDIFDTVVPLLVGHATRHDNLLTAICDTQIELLSMWPDSLVARKHGGAVARELQREAEGLWARRDRDDYETAYRECDRRLRTGQRRINPGTTADLIAAGLFVALTEDRIGYPNEYEPRK